MLFDDEQTELADIFNFGVAPAEETQDGPQATKQPAITLTTVLDDAMAALDEEPEAEAETLDEQSAAHENAEAPENILADESTSIYAMGEAAIPEPVGHSQDAATIETISFDENMLAIMKVYEAFVPSEVDGMPVVLAPPAGEGAACPQVITRGPDGRWYADPSLTTPIDGFEVGFDPGFEDGVYHILPVDPEPIVVICPVIDWEGGRYLPEPVDESVYTLPYFEEEMPVGICPVIGWEGGSYLPEPGADVMLG